VSDHIHETRSNQDSNPNDYAAPQGKWIVEAPFLLKRVGRHGDLESEASVDSGPSVARGCSHVVRRAGNPDLGIASERQVPGDLGGSDLSPHGWLDKEKIVNGRISLGEIEQKTAGEREWRLTYRARKARLFRLAVDHRRP
jgi:hypothetical protein